MTHKQQSEHIAYKHTHISYNNNNNYNHITNWWQGGTLTGVRVNPEATWGAGLAGLETDRGGFLTLSRF
jgi:hypothetical protein